MPISKASASDSPAKALQKFAKDVRSILWGMDEGTREKRVNYLKWEARVQELQDESGLTKNVAICQASKEFSSLLPLFRKHDVSKYDLDLGEEGKVGPTVSQEKLKVVVSEGKTLSRMEEMEWAALTAGKFLRTREMPATCPNDAAFLWFQQAIEEGKHFLDKLMQMTCKNMDEAEQQHRATLSGRRCVKEIEDMLEVIEQKYVEPEKKKYIAKDAEGNRK